AMVNLGYTKIYAPGEGTVGERQVRTGQLVSPGAQVIAFVDVTKWVQANYRETQLTNVKIGDAAELRIDQYPGQVLHGTVLEIARAVGAAVPAEVAAQPLLGILGVVLGAGVVTLTSRMISLGMPDFRGLHGFGYDESTWIGSAFDAGLMFIGPFTVFLGGLMGPRRILLTAAALFPVLFVFLPFAHSYSLVITLPLLRG